MDEPRVPGTESGVVHSQRRQRRRLEVGHEDIRPLDQPVHDFPARLALEVEGDAALVAVHQFEDVMDVADQVATFEAGDAAHLVTDQRGFHLDDVGSPVGQNCGGAGDGDDVLHLDDLDSLEASGHRLVSLARPVTRPSSPRSKAT